MLRCRFCDSALSTVFVDLGMSPLSNANVARENAMAPETFYPLKAFVCDRCFLVQVPPVATPQEIFGDYAYFSSYSSSWVEHCRRYADEMIAKLHLRESSRVVEIASNDGYLLQWFQRAGVPVLGVEPAGNVAKVAMDAGVPTRVAFFGTETAQAMAAEGLEADLLIGNNVLAHVPELNDFVKGLEIVLAAGGRLTMEFPHLLELIRGHQFDTIYHEHFSYFSLGTVIEIFSAHGLTVFDVEQLPTHGGSLRIHAMRTSEAPEPRETVAKLLDLERSSGLRDLATYRAFADAVNATKRDFLRFLIGARDAGKKVVGYGAPAKGNTLLNYCGVRSDLIEFTVDRNPHKQGFLLPGTHLEIREPDALYDARPDYVVILPWNLRDEIIGQTARIREWGGRWVTAVPKVEVIE